jgi:hypothetical protein
MTVGRKLAAVFVPWAFIVVYAALYWVLVLPRVGSGQWLAVCAGAFVALVFIVFFVAAVTFSRDVLSGQWP